MTTLGLPCCGVAFQPPDFFHEQRDREAVSLAIPRQCIIPVDCSESAAVGNVKQYQAGWWLELSSF
jgi:hypothetical protein